MLIVKWEGATKKGIQNNTTAPDINFRTCIQSKKKDDNANLKRKCHFFSSTYTLILYTHGLDSVYIDLQAFNEVHGHTPTLNACSP